MPAATPSSYEKTEILAIHEWKNPKLTWFDSAMKVVNTPFDLAGDLAAKVPGVEFVIEKALGGGLSLLTDGAAFTVRANSILGEFRPPLESLEETHDLELASVDRAIGYLAAKYKSLALVEGAAAGSAGSAGPLVGAAAIAADVTALLALNLRAVGEYATYCGFDISHQEERLFALNVLGLASAPTDAAKAVAMAQLVKISADVARRKTWQELERHAFVRVVQQIAAALSIRLTKAKLAQLVPLAGAAVGGGFNAYFTSKVCDAAFYLYRERFLARKYGPDIIEVTVNPATPDDYGAGYETA